jgi:hypothetical protein
MTKEYELRKFGKLEVYEVQRIDNKGDSGFKVLDSGYSIQYPASSIIAVIMLFATTLSFGQVISLDSVLAND